MKSIVVYKIVFLAWPLLLSMSLMAQKPAIDLISSHYLYQHPEAVIDTAYTVNPTTREAVLRQPQADHKRKARMEKKQRRQIGPSLDSLFQKEEDKRPAREKSQVNISIIHLRFNPVKFLIFITALK